MVAKLNFIHNGRASGPVAARLLRNNMDIGVLRPTLTDDGKHSYYTVADGTKNGKPRTKRVRAHNSATLRKDQWEQLDEIVLRVQRDKLNVWADIVGAGLSRTIPNAMGTTILQHQTMTDAGEATLSMSPLRKTKRDRVEFGLDGIPLPIVHSDFSFDIRSVATSKNHGGLGIDDIMVEQATHQCVQLIEDLTVGTLASYTYSGYSIYGLTNHPNRITKTLTLPTSANWTPEVTYNEILGVANTATRSLRIIVLARDLATLVLDLDRFGIDIVGDRTVAAEVGGLPVVLVHLLGRPFEQPETVLEHLVQRFVGLYDGPPALSVLPHVAVFADVDAAELFESVLRHCGFSLGGKRRPSSHRSRQYRTG